MSTFNFGTNLGRAGGKYLIKIIFDIGIKIGIFEISKKYFDGKYFKKIIFDIIRAINNWLYDHKLLYLDKLFKNDSFRILFPMILITRNFNFTFLFRVSNSQILFLFIRVSNSEILLFFCFFELVTRKFCFKLLFRVSNSKILICLFNSS